MVKYPFTNKELSDAVRVYAERRTDALKACLDREPVQFSPEFLSRIAQICSDADAAIKRRHRIRTRVAAAIIAFIVLVTAFFSVNTTARAGFVNWIKEIINEYIRYDFFGEYQNDGIPDLIATWIPDDLILTADEQLDASRVYTYENNDGKCFIIECTLANSGTSIYVDNDVARQHTMLKVNTFEINCYISEDDVSDYIWHDADGKFFFSMSSNLPHETNIKIIENLKIGE